MLPKNVLWYGKDEPLPVRRELRAGPLSLIYEMGDLRTVKLGDHEVIRRIYVAIRDRNWGTVPPVLSNLQMDIGDASFRISYDVQNKEGDIDFSWKGSITGDPQGRIIFSMDGIAHSTFLRNRIGFCVLHPAACAGTRCVIEHVDGINEQATLPVYVVPHQPVQPFAEMQAISHEVAPGVWAEVRYSGDIFEMEDQRNWTDASFKTFSTPLRIPYPAEVKAGTRIKQSVTLKVNDERTAGGGRSLAAQPAAHAGLRVTLGSSSSAKPLPPIGLAVASQNDELNERELARLKALHLHHLRVDLRLAEPDYPALLRRAAIESGALGVPLEVALLLSDQADAELQRLMPVLDESIPFVDTWLIYPTRELFWGGSPTEQVVTLARKHLPGYLSRARMGAGTNADLIFLQRNPPPLSLLDLVTFSITPQIHAFDNASIVETLGAQAIAVETARRIAGELPVAVSQVTLKPRFNAYATGPEPVIPPGQFPPSVDVRQMSLLAAGWTVGSIKYLVAGGASSITYYETTGWRGVMEKEAGSPLPETFHSFPGCVFPLYHVLADVGEYAGGQMLPLVSSDTLKVDGLALQRDGKTRVLLANLSPQLQQVSVQDLGQRARVRHLDETSAERAMRSPREFRATESWIVQDCEREGALGLKLLPYAVVCIDTV